MEKCGWVVEFVLWPDECPTKFQTLQKQWIVVLSFSWLENFRRLTIDYEYLANTAETMAQLEIVFYCHILDQYYVKNLKTLWHTATYVYNSPLRCTLQHLADDIENS